MPQPTESDTAAADNVRQFPGAGPEPPPRRKRRSRDRTGAARQAKFRSKNKGDRYDRRPTEDAPSSPHVDAPPIAPTVTSAEEQSVTPSPVDLSKPPARATAPEGSAGTRLAEHHRIDRLTLLAALALATVSAGFSIYGMTSIFVGAFLPVIAMGVALELGKLRAVTWIGRNSSSPAWGLKGALAALVIVLMGLNVVGAFGFLAKAHIGHRVEGDVAVAGRSADVEARLSVQAERVADLTKQIGDLDAARPIETPSTGNLRTASAISAQAAALAATAKLRAADDERRQAKRTGLADRLTVEAKALADLKIEEAKIGGERRTAEADLGPVRYLATLMGAGDQDILRWFILVVALLLDPAAVLLLLAAVQ
jgi:hypothetical protein